MTRYVSVSYEIFGRVQGVWFRKYTKDKAIELNLVGYVKNTERGTVSGIAQGEREKIECL
ncbi:1594_t:CDS:2 [Funneliformis geosporum]|uniref:Acylphosphatase n=1 Tax=Funneliformis geosporum TaxID=1117311 RepID=A0A9W4SBM0_9GLOM|nr:1594_t:CDS:2 [Funneliformis geosporum]CAI2163373.1 19536_t:CDS:2 [Funneliformis geosporum]